MTPKSMILSAAAFVMAVAPAFATDHRTASSHLDEIVTSAKKTQLEAREISNLLKVKTPDYDRVRTKMQLLTEHAADVNRLVAELEASNPSLSSSQQAEFNRLKEIAKLVDVFVTNKNNLLASSDLNRKLLRAKADGIAKRAEMVQESAIRIRS